MTDHERQVLAIEARTWPRRHIGAKDTAIRQLGLGTYAHAQLVSALIRRADVVAEEPVLCARLRRLEDARRGARSQGRVDWSTHLGV